jgi:hypothetical protein
MSIVSAVNSSAQDVSRQRLSLHYVIVTASLVEGGIRPIDVVAKSLCARVRGWRHGA